MKHTHAAPWVVSAAFDLGLTIISSLLCLRKERFLLAARRNSLRLQQSEHSTHEKMKRMETVEQWRPGSNKKGGGRDERMIKGPVMRLTSM